MNMIDQILFNDAAWNIKKGLRILNMIQLLKQGLVYLELLWCAENDLLPIVNHQPELFMPTYYKTDEGLVVKGNENFLGEEDDRFFSIAFSIDYHNCATDNDEIIKTRFCLENVVVELMKYTRKDVLKRVTSYDKIKPWALLDSSNHNPNSDTFIFVSDELLHKQRGKLNPGCQYITLAFKTHQEELKNAKKCVKKLRKLFLNDHEKPEKYGFKFVATIPRKRGTGHDSAPIKLYTNMFALIFLDNGHNVRLEEVDQTDYCFSSGKYTKRKVALSH